MSEKCEVCLQNEYKYKCPRCLMKSCSLDCSKKHKVLKECSGEKSSVAEYISSDVFKQNDDLENGLNHLVQRDYNFLTNFKRKYEVHKKDSIIKNKSILQASTVNKRYKNGYTDKNFANGDDNVCSTISRRGVNCIVLPKGMQRSLQNKSKWDKPMDCFVWTVEWVLLYSKADSEGKTQFKHVSHRAKETDSIIQCLGKIVYSKCQENFNISNPPHGKQDSEDEISKENRSESLATSNLKFLIKWFPENYNKQFDSTTLIEISDVTKCIGELFKNRTIIEFPTIFITDSLSNLGQFGFSLLKEQPDTIISTKREEDHTDNEAPEESSSSIPNKQSSSTLDTVVVPNDTPETTNIEPENSDSDSDSYDPGVTLDFLAE